MTVTGYAPGNLAPMRPDGSGTGILGRRTAFDDLADQAARLSWCWSALLTLLLHLGGRRADHPGHPGLGRRLAGRRVHDRAGHRAGGRGMAAAFVAREARAGDGIVYQASENQDSWLMVGYGLQYYLARDMPNGVPVPHELFIARTAAEAGTLSRSPASSPLPAWVPNRGSGSSASAARRAPTRR